MCLFTILLVLHVVYFIVLAKLSENVFVICQGTVAVLLLNVVVLFCVWVGLLFDITCMVFILQDPFLMALYRFQ